MGNIALWLGTLAWPLVTRVLVSAGIGTLTFAGVAAALNAALGAAKSAAGGLSGDIASVVAIGGGFTAMSIIAGGAVASLAFIVLKRFALQSGT